MSKEKWTRLGYSDLAEVLAFDEIEKLNEISLSTDIEDICQTQLDSIADTYRGAFQAKGYTIDQRTHYLPGSYRVFALCLARYYICSRFPNSGNAFLDEPRKKLYEKAIELIDDPVIGVPEPDYSDDPELSGNTEVDVDYSIRLPWQRILSMPGKYGFVEPFVAQYQLSGYFL